MILPALPLASLPGVPRGGDQQPLLDSDSRNACRQWGGCQLRGRQAYGRRASPRRGSGWM